APCGGEVGAGAGGPRFSKLFCEPRADVADSLDENDSSVEIRRAEQVRHRGADPVEHAAGGVWAWVAGAAPLLAAAEDVPVPLADDVHVGRRCVDVGTGLEVRTERGGELAIATEKAAAPGR